MKELDLNKIFPEIKRKSKRDDEAQYYNDLRLSPQVVIISGGQSGIDSIGLEIASFLGLPAYAIMPENKRRENGSIEEFFLSNNIKARIIELATPSYRFRTYANVFYSDVTIIYDFVKSDGTKATIDACEYFSRPYLVIQQENLLDYKYLIAFLLKYKPKIINIAGNSYNKLNKQIMSNVHSHLKNAIKSYCFRIKNNTINLDNSINQDDNPISIAIPNTDTVKNIFKDFLNEKFGINISYSKKLIYEFEQFNLILARPREIINLVKQGVTAGIVGYDLCLEYDYDNQILFDTGLVPNATMIIVNDENMVINNESKICSQYPNLAKKYLPNHKNIFSITGSAESYLKLGIYDFCVDSYQTGNTVNQNGLYCYNKLCETSLVLIGNSKIKKTKLYNSFIDYCIINE